MPVLSTQRGQKVLSPVPTGTAQELPGGRAGWPEGALGGWRVPGGSAPTPHMDSPCWHLWAFHVPQQSGGRRPRGRMGKGAGEEELSPGTVQPGWDRVGGGGVPLDGRPPALSCCLGAWLSDTFCYGFCGCPSPKAHPAGRPATAPLVQSPAHTENGAPLTHPAPRRVPTPGVLACWGEDGGRRLPPWKPRVLVFTVLASLSGPRAAAGRSGGGGTGLSTAALGASPCKACRSQA